jgi:NAD(P)-dependent dehydrogenase (short-subunit alcohol dehydrogenase family)
MENRKAILITGTSTGIGRACALHLDKLGYKVYAGVRREEDADSLRSEASENLTALILDVTDESSIETALSRIEQENDGKLFGLVNNAGIGISGVVEVTPIEEVRKVLDVNVIGLYALTKAAIPMIRKGKGRIINIGSSSSFFAFPGSSVYSASKFAVRAITDSLRTEMKLFDIPVALVAPGAIESDIWEKSLAYKKKLRETVSPEISELYSPFIKFGDKLIEDVKPIPAIEVAKAVTHAFTSRKPKIYYMVGKDAKGAAKAAKLPKRFLDWMIMKHVNKFIQ